MPQPALATPGREQPSQDTQSDARGPAPRARGAARAPATTAAAEARTTGASSGAGDRGAGALTRAQRALELLRAQVARLEAATGNRDFQAARWLAASLRTTAPGLVSSIEQARQGGADPAALAALERRTAALSPRLEAALTRAPAAARGLGFDLLDPGGEEQLEQAWLAALDGRDARDGAAAGATQSSATQTSPAQTSATQTTRTGSTGARQTSPRHAGATSIESPVSEILAAPTPGAFALLPTASPAKTLRAYREEMFAALDALSQRLDARLEAVHQLGAHTAGRADYSAQLLGKSLETRRHEANAELIALRLAIATGELEGPRLVRLVQRLEKLDFEAALITNIGALGQVFHLLDELENDRWVLLVEGLMATDSDKTYVGESGGRIGRLEAQRRGAATLKNGLATLHSRWLKVEQLAQLVEQSRAAAPDAGLAKDTGEAGALGGLLRRSTTALLEAEFANLRRLVATLGSDEAVRVFLEEALRTARSAQQRALITQLAAMLGIMLAAGLTGGAAAGFATGMGASSFGAAAAGAATDAAVFTALSTRLAGEGLGPHLLADFSANLATFGALRAVNRFLDASRVAKLLAAGSASSGRGVYLAAKLTNLSAASLAAAATQLAQAEAMSFARRGRALSEEELHQAAVQGLAMMIAGAILHRGMLASNDVLAAAGAGAGRHLANAARLRRLATHLADHPDPLATRLLLGDVRRHMEEGIALARQLEHLSPAELRARGLAPAAVKRMRRADERHLANLGRLEAAQLSRPSPHPQRSPHAGATARPAAVPASTKPPLARARARKVEVTKLHELHRAYRDGQGSTAGDFSYDPKTRTVSFEAESGGIRGRFEARLPPPIRKLADWSQPNRIIGTRTFQSQEAADHVLRQLSAGNLDILRHLGTEVPAHLGADIRKGLEFGIGELPNGEFAIIRGNFGEVEWNATLPGVIARGHTHADVEGNNLSDGSISIKDVVRTTPVPLVAREVIFPSVSDIQHVADHRVRDHRVFTPFVVEGGHIMKPTAGRSHPAHLEIVIHEALDIGYRTQQGLPVYKAEVSAHFDGTEVFRTEIYAVADGDKMDTGGVGLYMELPANLKKVQQ